MTVLPTGQREDLTADIEVRIEYSETHITDRDT
ncbi:hypothetical protein JOF55_004064 [Haloactinomyces albus]|uniref:Uncharacterized protein n=1 Tax=Haloactinomyces albus TaxID=1352928 RepID=A0AAE4CRN3_9ACTN|nr:hypothetical protein [Haloactinomyces albus]